MNGLKGTQRHASRNSGRTHSRSDGFSPITASARLIARSAATRPRAQPRAAFAEAARRRVKAEHDILSAARRLNAVFEVVSSGSWA